MKPSLLFVCLGNICRSPTVEEIARVEFARAGLDVEVASAGTADYHIGRGADPRTIATARLHGYELAAHRARQLTAEDFQRWQHVLVMDRSNLEALAPLVPAGARGASLFLDDRELPDPYYGEQDDFDLVIELAREGVQAWIERLRGRTG